MSVIDYQRNDLAIEYLHAERVVVFRLDGNKREMLDAYANAMIESVTAWNQDDPVHLSLHDVRNCGVSPYTRARLEDIIRARPDLKSYYAVLLPAGLLGNVIKGFAEGTIRRMDQKMRPDSHIKCFTDEAAVQQWLASFLDVK